MRVAVIPARGGSKRIPRKNIKIFCGKPMIAWSILTAKNSGLFDEIVVSTDDHEIMEIAKEYGALVPFIRPENLSGDHVATAPVISHATKFMVDSLHWNLDYVCCIYPCAPFINQEDLISCFNLVSSKKGRFSYPVTEYPHPIQRALRLLPDKRVEFLSPENELLRTQDLEIVYHDAGQFYWGIADAWILGERMHSEGLGLEIPNWRVVDIDTMDDWMRAELLFQSLNTSKSKT